MDKPIFSNQYGALVMAFVPFIYGISASHWVWAHLWLGLSWLFIYFCSYPFLSLFSKKSNPKYQKWALIYAVISVLFALPLLVNHFAILQFALPILPLVLIQIYYTKQRDERNLLNDIAGILIFGVVGMASFYLATARYNLDILIHPTLFFIATTLYIKSVARERKNPRYTQLSLASHVLGVLLYALMGYYWIALAYLAGLARAWIVPSKKLSIKQIGLLEFPMVLLFTIALIVSQ